MCLDLLCCLLIVVCVCLCVCSDGAVVHWSRWMAMGVLILATLLMAACADLTTEHIKPILDNSKVSQVG